MLQCTVKPHIPLTHTVPSPDLETPPEPDSLVRLHTSGGGGGVKNKEVLLHSELCGCQCLPSTRRGGAAVLTPAALTLSGWRTQPVSSFLAASRDLIWTLPLLLWRAESLARASGNCGRRGGSVVTVEPLHDLIMTCVRKSSFYLCFGIKAKSLSRTNSPHHCFPTVTHVLKCITYQKVGGKKNDSPL